MSFYLNPLSYCPCSVSHFSLFNRHLAKNRKESGERARVRCSSYPQGTHILSSSATCICALQFTVFCSHFLASHLSVVNLFPADCFHPTPDSDGSTCFTHFWFPTLPFPAGGAGGVCCDHRSERAERVQVSSTFLGPPIQELFRSDHDGLGMIRNTPMFRSSFFPASSYLTYPAPISFISYCTLVPGNMRFPLSPCIVFAFLVFFWILL